MDSKTRKILNRWWRGRSFKWGGIRFKRKKESIEAVDKGSVY